MFHDDSALCSPIPVLADGKQTDRVLAGHCQVQRCEEFCGIKTMIKVLDFHPRSLFLLCGAVCANDVFNFIIVRVQESIRLGP